MIKVPAKQLRASFTRLNEIRCRWERTVVSFAAVFLDVMQRSPNVLGERCVTSKKRLRGRLEGRGRAREELVSASNFILLTN